MIRHRPLAIVRRAFCRALVTLAAAPWFAGMARADTQLPDPDDAAPAAAQARFAFDAIRLLAERDRGATVVLSPASVGAALAVIAVGADRALKDSICNLLHLRGHEAQRSLDGVAREMAQAAEGGPLITANALMIDPVVVPLKAARQAVMATGAQFLDTVAFGQPEAVDTVNRWVAEHTRDHIRGLFDVLPADTGLVALNALYFKDRWKTPFDVARTASAPFRLAGGGEAEAKLMRSESDLYLFRISDRYVAVDLAFATPDYRMLLVTSTDEPLPAQDFGAVSGWLSGGGFKPLPGTVALPRFALSAGLDLKPALTALGLEQRALTGFSGEPLQIGAVQQRVELTVDEQGAEAAAASAIAGTRSVAPHAVQFVADKPFLFAVRNVRNGLILVAGYVAKP